MAVEWLVGGESKRGCPGPVVMMKLLPPATANVPKITIPSKVIMQWFASLGTGQRTKMGSWRLQTSEVQCGGQFGASLAQLSSTYRSDWFQLWLLASYHILVQFLGRSVRSSLHTSPTVSAKWRLVEFSKNCSNFFLDLFSLNAID